MLRIPIARLGRWYHPIYKNNKGEPVVEFTQDDFDSIMHVFNSDDRGYEPYLTYGHVKSSFDKFTIDGFPIVGYLDSIEQVGDVLFGDFTPSNSKVTQEIMDGNYRYSSGEFVPNAKAKKSDEVFRMFLKGVALTNTPFVPNLPVNQIKASEPASEFALLSDYLDLDLDIANSSNVCYNSLDDVGNDVQGPDREMSEETRPESTQENVIEQTEDVKEIKSMLSDFTTWMKSIFAGKTITDEQLVEEVDLTEETEVAAITPEVVVEETVEPPVVEIEENEMEDIKPADVVVETASPDADLVAKLAAMEEEKARLEAAVQELANKATALEQEKLVAAQAAAEQILSDKIADLTNKFGLAPAVADKVKSLATNGANTTISLSDGNQINLADAVLDLVTDLMDTSNVVELDQVGAAGDVTALSEDADNPWADVIKKYRDTQSK